MEDVISVKMMRGVGFAITVMIISVVMNTTRGGAYDSALETNYSRGSMTCRGDLTMATCLPLSDDIDLELSLSSTHDLVSVNLATFIRPGDLTGGSNNAGRPVVDCGRNPNDMRCVPQDNQNMKRPEHCFDSTYPPRNCFQ